MNNQPLPPRKLLPWLTYVDFLTKKLYEKSGHTSLSVLSQGWGMASWWDRHVLGLDFGQVFHRDIVTSAWDESCWYARTVIPLATYQADSTLFDRLKTETLGALIFEGTKIKRVSLVHYPINKQMIEFQWLTTTMYGDSDILWVRSSAFTLASGDLFYLIEILLPGLETYLCQT
ncbi:MAG: chorismate lyase [Legionellaceae bacterium]|nr:chorismate lyase [Legionellaceae bacterium]